jgi:hypothetical protein
MILISEEMKMQSFFTPVSNGQRLGYSMNEYTMAANRKLM